MQHLTHKVKTVRVHAPVSAGQTNVTDATVIDMANFEGVRFIVGFGTITSGGLQSVKVLQAAAKSSDTALTSGADLEGSGITVADDDDNSLVITDIVKPQERYVQVQVQRGTQNSVVDFILAEVYGARKLPVEQDATVSSYETLVSPDEGTA